MPILAASIAYCGSPPIPGSEQWNLDPVLIVVLAVVPLRYALQARRISCSRGQVCSFAMGWTLFALALVSPLCNVSVALFSARTVQHMLIMLIAMPLLVIGGADLMVGKASGTFRGVPGKVTVAGSILAFSAALWIWHMPGPYDATFHDDVAYWLMHLTMAGSAFALWHVLLRAELGSMFIASTVAAAQMAGLGAILTFIPRPLYNAHFATTWPWGLTTVEDQALGGLIMWVPGGFLLALTVLAALARHLQRLDNLEHQSLSAR